MTRLTGLRGALAALYLSTLPLAPVNAAADAPDTLQRAVARVVGPLMSRYDVPGVAVAIVGSGERHVFTFGVASRSTGKPVDAGTLFEIGSVSKTFTATLAAYAQIEGRLSLSDHPGKYLPTLRGSRLDEVTLLELGTHTPGGLPLQVPAEITSEELLLGYFNRWQPTYPPGTYRTYANPGIGLLGLIVAKSFTADFTALMEGKLFPALDLKNTFLNVPTARISDYAQGYTDQDVPIRMTPGVLSAETYGVRTTAGDLLRFVEANMRMLPLDEKWQQAVMETHTGYYQLGGMTQDLIWEQYAYPVALPTLLAGNSDDVILRANPVTRVDPPSPPRDDVLIDKTGSTNGFSTYVAFVPARRVGVVLLANKRFPIEARVRVVHEILTLLDGR